MKQPGPDEPQGELDRVLVCETGLQEPAPIMASTSLAEFILIVNAASTWFMVGVIWMVQIVQYPGFREIEAAHFPRFHREHSRRITVLVLPGMALELGTSLALLWRHPDEIDSLLIWAGILCAVLVWISTLAIQVPKHQSLGGGRDDATIESLIKTNWLRTAFWTAHGVITLVMLSSSL